MGLTGNIKICCFGEVLWDVFPAHRKIGGAPLNVALRLQSFGVDTNMISRIGNDELGNTLMDYLKTEGLGLSGIQVDDALATGQVIVSLDSNGSASYEIAYPAAWDKIAYTHSIKTLVSASDAFIFGSLACRDEISKLTLFKLLADAKFKVFDLNLRTPYYDIQLINALMIKSDFIKCNEEELNEVCLALGFDLDNEDEQIRFLAKSTQTAQICITKGKDGAILYLDGTIYDQKAPEIKVVDTVGAGDSFLAALIYKLLSTKSPKVSLTFASEIGALVAQKEGANPKLTL